MTENIIQIRGTAPIMDTFQHALHALVQNEEPYVDPQAVQQVLESWLWMLIWDGLLIQTAEVHTKA